MLELDETFSLFRGVELNYCIVATTTDVLVSSHVGVKFW